MCTHKHTHIIGVVAFITIIIIVRIVYSQKGEIGKSFIQMIKRRGEITVVRLRRFHNDL